MNFPNAETRRIQAAAIEHGVKQDARVTFDWAYRAHGEVGGWAWEKRTGTVLRFAGRAAMILPDGFEHPVGVPLGRVEAIR